MTPEEQRKKEIIATKIMLLQLEFDELEFKLMMAESQLKQERFNTKLLFWTLIVSHSINLILDLLV